MPVDGQPTASNGVRPTPHLRPARFAAWTDEDILDRLFEIYEQTLIGQITSSAVIGRINLAGAGPRWAVLIRSGSETFTPERVDRGTYRLAGIGSTAAA